MGGEGRGGVTSLACAVHLGGPAVCFQLAAVAGKTVLLPPRASSGVCGRGTTDTMPAWKRAAERGPGDGRPQRAALPDGGAESARCGRRGVGGGCRRPRRNLCCLSGADRHPTPRRGENRRAGKLGVGRTARGGVGSHRGGEQKEQNGGSAASVDVWRRRKQQQHARRRPTGHVNAKGNVNENGQAPFSPGPSLFVPLEISFLKMPD